MTGSKPARKRKTEPRYFNRELSWLQFNMRVLGEAQDETIPLLERLKFLAITASNLDEFFMVRVGGLQLLEAAGKRKRDPSGRTPIQQLKDTTSEARRLIEAQYTCYRDQLIPALEQEGIRRLLPEQLSAQQRIHVQQIMDQDIYPVLSPIALSDTDRPPLLANLRLHLAVRLKPAKGVRKPKVAVIALAPSMNRFIALPYADDFEWVLLEDVIAMHAAEFFPGEEVVECAPFRITRNADMSVREDMAADLMTHMENALDARKTGACVRLEIAASATAGLARYLREHLDVRTRDVYPIDGPIDFSPFMKFTGMIGRHDLSYQDWEPSPCHELPDGADPFKLLRERDILLYHPYDTFDPVVQLVQAAAVDPDVLAIKQILYRTTRNSKVVGALVRAAERGKHVTAVVELKARFDEARNIDQATALEQAGAQVIYGVKGLKTHAKILMIVRREPDGIIRYMHYGTGNYNEGTARLYGDVSLMTSNAQLGTDAGAFFNAITGYSQPQSYGKLVAAPTGLRERILQLIDAEIERKKQGQKAEILAKVNSLADPILIDKLYEASNAGVKVRLNIRGICCLRPGVKGLSENITVVSILDRYLEHARIMLFHHGGDKIVKISSADWMPRNLDRRIETLVPVEDERAKKRLIKILETHLKDDVKGHLLQPDGTYLPGKKRSSGQPGSQEVLHRETAKRSRRIAQQETTVFEPHLPGDR